MTAPNMEAPGKVGTEGRAQGIANKRDCRRAEQAAQAARSHDDDYAQATRRRIKRLIVLAACWGFPAAWADWLIQHGGLKHD